MLKSNNSYGFQILKMLTLALSSALFIPVSCTSIEFTLLRLDIPFEKIEPSSHYYPLFFRVAMQSEGTVNYVMLSKLPTFKHEHPNYSFILPKTPSHCESFICYQVLVNNGSEQIIEVKEYPDSLFAVKVWSRYQAAHSDFTPISLKKSSMNVAFYAFVCSMILYVIGKVLRKKIMSATD